MTHLEGEGRRARVGHGQVVGDDLEVVQEEGTPAFGEDPLSFPLIEALIEPSNTPDTTGPYLARFRLEGADLDQTSSEAKRLVTNRARTLVEAAHDPGDLNEALIELGATVCTPRNPACDRCPLNHTCRAHAEGTTDRIPRPKKQAAKTPLYCAAILVKDARDRTLIEQRPGTGLWARMFQAPTLERPDAPWTPADIAAALNIEPPSPADTFRHQTTHRDVEFRVFQATKAASLRPGDGRRFATRREIESLALSNPQRRILLGDQPR